MERGTWEVRGGGPLFHGKEVAFEWKRETCLDKKEGKNRVGICGCIYLTGMKMKGREVKEQMANCVMKIENLHGEA